MQHSLKDLCANFYISFPLEPPSSNVELIHKVISMYFCYAKVEQIEACDSKGYFWFLIYIQCEGKCPSYSWS